MYDAERHDAEAQLKVSLMFEVRSRVDQHIDRAVVYFKLSARGRNKSGQFKAQEDIRNGHGVEHPRKMDIQMVEATAEQGHIGAQNLCIRNRIGGIKSI